MPLFVNIALPLPAKNLFSYEIPAEMIQDELVGVRALVPFGTRTLTGVIVEADNVVPTVETKRVFELLDESPVFTSRMLQLTKWIAEYYFASWGETLKSALPQGMSPQTALYAEIAEHLSEDEITEMARRAPKRAALLRELMKHEGAITVGYLEKQLGSDSVSAQLEALENRGIISTRRILADEVQAKTQKALILHPMLRDDAEFLRDTLDELERGAPKQALLLSHIYLHGMHHEEPLLAAEALKATKAPASAIDALVRKSFLEERVVEVIRKEKFSPNGQNLIQREESTLRLTLEQEHAVSKIAEALETGKYKSFLLHGVTGSGKTLVYVHAIHDVLARGKSALLLVPEISLTPQLIDRFQAIFGEKIAVMHSKLSQGERYDMWREMQRGNVQIVIGARSALFAPLKNLGIIIVDEEHEPSYKQESPSPRYNARDCAIIRGTMEDAIVVLGSATPSVESMYNAGTGKFHLLEIRERADGAKLPDVSVVDLGQARKNKTIQGSFTTEMLEAIRKRVEKKEGVILFQNRRGFSRWLECFDCGHVPKCRDCDVSLTFHKYRFQLRCHYCGYTIPAHKACLVCGNPDMKEIGAGTQKIEEELAVLLRKRGVVAAIQRMDLDTTTKKGAHRKILQSFANGETDILVGTQMVAKGLDFSRVTLVGVINADLQLYLPDFRSAERTFQLLTQVAGRAGRSSEFRGEVLIQTAHPLHQTILAAESGSYELFYNDELQMRLQADYPPFSRFTVIELSGLDEGQVEEHAQLFARYLPTNNPAVQKIGPAVPTLPRLRSRYRRVIIIKNPKQEDPSGIRLRKTLQHAQHAYNQHHATSAVKVTIDIDSYMII